MRNPAAMAWMALLVACGVTILLGTGGDSMSATYYPHRSLEAREQYYAHYDEQAQRWPVEYQEQTVDTSFGSTFIRVSGPEDAPPLVLVPGDTDTSLSWIPFIEELSANHRTFAIDHVYDYGRSVRTRPMKRPEDFVTWLDEVLISLGLERTDLMSYSYGSWQASMYALAHPERIRKLILIAPAATVEPPSIYVVLRAVLQDLFPTRSIMTSYMYWLCEDEVRLGGQSKATVDQLIDELLFSRKCYVRRRFVMPTNLSDEEWAALALAVPTLCIAAENDKTHNAPRAIERLIKVAPALETEMVEGIGHQGFAILKADWVTERVLRFLEDTDS